MNGFIMYNVLHLLSIQCICTIIYTQDRGLQSCFYIVIVYSIPILSLEYLYMYVCFSLFLYPPPPSLSTPSPLSLYPPLSILPLYPPLSASLSVQGIRYQCRSIFESLIHYYIKGPGELHTCNNVCHLQYIRSMYNVHVKL